MGKKKEYNVDGGVKGGEGEMMMRGEYEKVVGMEMYGEYVMKGMMRGDMEKEEEVGM